MIGRRRTQAWGLVLSSVLFLSGCSGHDLRKGFRNEEGILRREGAYSILPFSSELPLGGMEYVSPILHDQALLFGSMRFGVVSYYPKINRVRWKLELPNGLLSQLEVSGDRGFFTGGDGRLYAISLESGKTEWTYDLRNPVSSKPKVSGSDLFVVTSDDALLSLESQSGKWQWHYRRRNASGTTIHGATQPLVLGDSVWVGFADGALVALTKKEGKVLWERQLNTQRRFSGLNAEMVEQEGLVFVPAYDQALYALNARNGNPVWVKENAGGSHRVTLAQGILYAPSSSGHLLALDPKTGREYWSFELDGGVPSEPVVTDQYVIFTSTHEYLYVLDRVSGKLVHRFQAGYDSGFSGAPAFDSLRRELFAMSRGGNLYRFRYLK